MNNQNMLYVILALVAGGLAGYFIPQFVMPAAATPPKQPAQGRLAGLFAPCAQGAQ